MTVESTSSPKVLRRPPRPLTAGEAVRWQAQARCLGRWTVLAAGMGYSCLSGLCQDARHVTEPTIPPACATLDAVLQSDGRTLSAEDEGRLDTLRLQSALDACSPGHAVVLRAQGLQRAFLSGPLALRSGVALVVESGVILFASRDPELYAQSPGSCGVVNEARSGCNPLLSATGVRGAAVMGDGTIDGRGWAPMLGSRTTWWALAEQARSGGRQQTPRLLVADHADDFTLYGITLSNSPNFHVVYKHGDGLTAWGVHIDTPQRGARNTDGIDPGPDARNITITHSFIRTGDDDVALKGGVGGVTQVTVSHNHFYWGHGMSIGSETNGGIGAVRVFDLSLDGPDNGIRLKSNGSRGGLVQDVLFEDVCIRNSPKPIVFETGYTDAGTAKGNSPPTFRDITLRNIRISGGGKLLFQGYDAAHGLSVTLDDVLATDTAQYAFAVTHARIVLGPGPVNLKPTPGEDATLIGKPSQGAAKPCAAMFVPFPVESAVWSNAYGSRAAAAIGSHVPDLSVSER